LIAAISPDDHDEIASLRARVAALEMKVVGQDYLLRAYRLGTQPPARAFTMLRKADAAIAALAQEGAS